MVEIAAGLFVWLVACWLSAQLLAQIGGWLMEARYRRAAYRHEQAEARRFRRPVSLRGRLLRALAWVVGILGLLQLLYGVGLPP
jgi:hypothetical protein